MSTAPPQTQADIASRRQHAQAGASQVRGGQGRGVELDVERAQRARRKPGKTHGGSPAATGPKYLSRRA